MPVRDRAAVWVPDDDRDVSAAGQERLATIRAFCDLGLGRAGVDGISVTVAYRLESLEQVHATDSLAENLVDLEQTLGQGPGLDSFSSDRPCGVEDLSSSTAGERWPFFAPEALAIGVMSVHAFPMSTVGRSLGAVSMYRKSPGPLTAYQLTQAVSVTELINLALVDPGTEEQVVRSVRMAVHQAAGMVMQQTGLSITDALVLLKTTAFAENVLVHELATDVVERNRRFPHMEIPI